MFCLERLVLFVSLSLSMPQSSLLYTHFERSIHELKYDRMLYVLHLYLSSVIILLYELHLDLLVHGGGFILKKILISHASLKLF